jgi:hypothetical protein
MARKKAKRKARKAAPRRRRAYVSNPAPVARRRRKYRRNPGLPVASMLIQAAAGAAGAIGAPKLADLLPIPAALISAAVIALGAGAFMFARKMPAVQAAGFGAMVIGVRNLAVNAVPMLAGDEELTADEIQALIEFQGGEDDYLTPHSSMGAPLGAPLGAALAGMNTPAM